MSDWIGVARNATEWLRLMKKQEQRENGNFGPNENSVEDNCPRVSFGSPTPYIFDRYTVTPQRIIPISNTMSRRDALKVLNLDSKCSDSEIRRKYRFLARKYHPDKWCDRCVFSRSEGEEIFKSIANAFNKLGGR